jgi:hypothetical protein
MNCKGLYITQPSSFSNNTFHISLLHHYIILDTFKAPSNCPPFTETFWWTPILWFEDVKSTMRTQFLLPQVIDSGAPKSGLREKERYPSIKYTHTVKCLDCQRYWQGVQDKPSPPRGQNTTNQTWSLWSVKVCTTDSILRSHNWIVLSLDPVARQYPSWLTSKLIT